ncbi:hypothetical protein OIU84_022712 [Salix udensis]|uniref:Uncharacterized protein n=1 Tax=Salix udensis TaxID=889485 RepID=A0AAD6KPN5_9ROSI|nr:hypothetical protein OIU84_022712 [Salix udensis]
MFDLYHEHRQLTATHKKPMKKYATFLRNHRRPLDHQSFVFNPKEEEDNS